MSTKTEDMPKRIYLIPDGNNCFTWCEDPAPGNGMRVEDSTCYVRERTKVEKLVYALMQGQEHEALITQLLELTQIDSEEVRQALILHYCKGYAATMACMIVDIKASNFSRAKKRLNAVYATVCRIKLSDL